MRGQQQQSGMVESLTNGNGLRAARFPDGETGDEDTTKTMKMMMMKMILRCHRVITVQTTKSTCDVAPDVHKVYTAS